MQALYGRTSNGAALGFLALGIDATTGQVTSNRSFTGDPPVWTDIAVAQDLNGRIDQIGSLLDSQREEMDAQAALVSAMNFTIPVNGDKNRFGTDLGHFNGTTAIGFTYTRVEGPFDAHVSFATTGEFSAGSVGIGYSW